MRAVSNFAVTGVAIGQVPELVAALATVKWAAASANRDLGRLNAATAAQFIQACEEIRAGAFANEFVADPIQGGAGTSTRMNANEVTANRLLQLSGHSPGDYEFIDPLAHANLGQATNDVYPTAVKLCVVAHTRSVDAALERLALTFAQKEAEFADVLKMAHTQLKDGVPMTLGQECCVFALMLREDRQRLAETALLLLETHLGGTPPTIGAVEHPKAWPHPNCPARPDNAAQRRMSALRSAFPWGVRVSARPAPTQW